MEAGLHTQLNAVQTQLRDQQTELNGLHTQLGVLRDTLTSRDRELGAMRLCRSQQEVAVEEMRSELAAKEEEYRGKVGRECV